MFSDKKKDYDEVRVFKIETDNHAEVFKGEKRKNNIKINFTNESLTIPAECSHFYWVEKGTLSSKIYKCYLAIQDFPHAVNYKVWLDKVKGMKENEELTYNPSDIESLLSSKIYQDFLNVEAKTNLMTMILLICASFGLGIATCFLVLRFVFGMV